MKKLFPTFLLMLATASIGFAQMLTIAPKKTVYTRKGKFSFKEKRTFTVIYPVVSGAIPPTAKKSLDNTLSYWRVFDTTLRENQVESDWLAEMSYKVNYNKNGVLDIALTTEGSGAYPDSTTRNLIVNTKTGEQVKFADAFKTDALDKFAAMVDVKLKIETGEMIGRINKGEFGENGKEADDSLKEQLSGLNFTAETFNEYSVSDKGVTIFYDAEFPHVIQAAQPDGRYFFTWAQAKPFIKPDGLLAKFIR